MMKKSEKVVKIAAPSTKVKPTPIPQVFSDNEDDEKVTFESATKGAPQAAESGDENKENVPPQKKPKYTPLLPEQVVNLTREELIEIGKKYAVRGLKQRQRAHKRYQKNHPRQRLRRIKQKLEKQKSELEQKIEEVKKEYRDLIKKQQEEEEDFLKEGGSEEGEEEGDEDEMLDELEDMFPATQ